MGDIFVCLLSVSLPAWLAGCQPACLAGWLSVCLPGWLAGCLSACLPGWLAVCLPGWLAGCLSVSLSVCVCVCSVCVCVCLCVCLCLCLCLSVSVCLSVCMHVCMHVLTIAYVCLQVTEKATKLTQGFNTKVRSTDMLSAQRWDSNQGVPGVLGSKLVHPRKTKEWIAKRLEKSQQSRPILGLLLQ